MTLSTYTPLIRLEPHWLRRIESSYDFGRVAAEFSMNATYPSGGKEPGRTTEIVTGGHLVEFRTLARLSVA